VRADMAPRKLVLYTEILLLPVSVLMAALVGGGHVETWMVYPFELAYGFGGMVNMTAQREVLFRMSGPERSTRVLNVELASMASAMMLGPLIGGLSIAVFGLGVAFTIPAVLLSCSAPLLWFSTRQVPLTEPALAVGAVAGTAPGATWRLLRRSRALVVILLVTVICNLCYFAFIPLVPVIAKHLGAGPIITGVIGSTAGVVQLVVAAGLIVWPPRRPLRAYALGVVLCLCCLAVLAYTPILAVALCALAVAGIGQGLFGTTQATLPVAAVASHERPAALGLLATTIGVALPTGMVVLGVMSTLLGARMAMLVSALVGLAAVAATLLRNQDLMRAPAPSGGASGVGGEGDSITAQPELGQCAGLPVFVLDHVLEPDERRADLDADQFGGLLVGGDRPDRGAAAADAYAKLPLEEQDDVRFVGVESTGVLLAKSDVVDGQAKRDLVLQHQALDHEDCPPGRQP
ncbi:MAG: hypothetical protein QOK02_468, partial [Mycobacterium sp.]|nr:hypothetical protein [Mycobacterium sp.]